MIQHNMHKSIRFALALALTAVLWGIGAGQSYAQTTPPKSTATPTPVPSAPHAQVIGFTDLGIPEQTLEGPFGAARLQFGLPAFWKLKAGAVLELHFRTFTTEADSDSENPDVEASAGVLKLSLNDTRLASIPLGPNEERVVTIPITTTALTPMSDDGQYALHVQFDNRANCGLGTASTVVSLLTSSRFSLPFDVTSMPTDLSLLPRPLFQQSFLGERATIVVPDKPTASELQAALLVAASFGRMTHDRLALSLLPIDQVTAATSEDTHLIFVGKSGAFPVLQTMALRLRPGPAGFALPDTNAGVIQLATSPLTNTRAALVVSGNTDEGVVKAGKALASGKLAIGPEKSLAFVTQVPTDSVQSNASEVDRSFANLGYNDWRMAQAGRSRVSYAFDLPLDTVADAEPYLDLFFSHSKLPNSNESGMTVSVNNDTVANVQFSEPTTPVTSTRIFIPRAAIRSGRNEITINATLKAQNECMDDNTAAPSLSIGSNSTLHIPTRAALPQTAGTLDLGAYPEPFDNSLTLSSTAFVLANADPASWSAAVRLASNLASKTSGESVAIVAAYGDNVPMDLRNSRNLLIVGQPSKLPLIADLQAQLPAPFTAGSDDARNRTTNTAYRPGETVGYLQLLPSPWNERRVVLTVLGSTNDGINWASTALLAPPMLQSLSGNFAIVIADQVFLGGTRLSSPAAPTATGVAAANPPVVAVAPVPANRYAGALAPEKDTRLLPIILSFFAMLFVLGAVLGFSWWRRQRAQAKR